MLNTQHNPPLAKFWTAVFVATFFILAQAHSIAADLRVPQDFATIQKAVDAAQPGDAIVVASGTFVENVLINRSDIALKGDQTLLQVANAQDPGIGIHI